MDKRLLSYAARLFDVPAEQITDPEHTRNRAVVRARAGLVWALIRARPLWTRQEIATLLGMRDRKSVYTANLRAEEMYQIDRMYQSKLDRLLLVAGREDEEVPPPPPQRSTLRIVRQPDALAIWMFQARGGIAVRTA